MERSLILIVCTLLLGCGKSNKVNNDQPGRAVAVVADKVTMKPPMAGEIPLNIRYCIVNDTLGAGGYDLITFFEEEAPKKGITKFAYLHDGLTYLFTNEVNRDRFSENPQKYLPQFGGWCATNMAQGVLTVPKYDLYLIAKNKLYLFERTLSVNGKQVWLASQESIESKAIENYKYLTEYGKFPN